MRHFPTEAAARRELKRRVLGLFPEVRVPCPACRGLWKDVHVKVPGSSRVVECWKCHGEGTVAPAGLIPPEVASPPAGTWTGSYAGHVAPEDAP